MNTESRSISSFRNAVTGVISQVTGILLSFVVRSIFIQTLNSEYLGINGFFLNLLSVLSLAELGFGSAMVYRLYEPLANKDAHKISQLMAFYKTVYKKIGFTIGSAGLLIIPFLGLLMKGHTEPKHITLIYFLFLFNTVSTYFFAYKGALVAADRRDYILSRYKLCFIIVKSSLSIIILFFTKNFLLYLLAHTMCILAENLVISWKACRLYPFLHRKHKDKLEKKEIKKIWSDVKALFIYKLGGTALDGTDNIIISAFIGISSVGILSNYVMVMNAAAIIISQFTKAVTASVGNFIALEQGDRQEELFDMITFLHFLLYGTSTVCIYTLVNPFITLWIGPGYLFQGRIIFLICLNWYLFGMLQPVWMFRQTYGLFTHGRYRPLVSALLNISISVSLAMRMGLAGVLLGTTITRLVTNVWFDPYIVYRYGLHKSVKLYFVKWISFLTVVLADIAALSILSGFLPGSTAPILILKLIIAVSVTLASFCLLFGKTEEMQYLNRMGRRFLKQYLR